MVLRVDCFVKVGSRKERERGVKGQERDKWVRERGTEEERKKYVAQGKGK